MLFSSIPFLFYFLPIVLLLYFVAPKKLKNTVLLLPSLFFYGWGEPKFLIFMLISIIQGYVFGLLIEKYQITVKNYEQSLTAVSTRLVQYVPKALMAYQCRRLDLLLKEKTRELETASLEDQLTLLTEITSLNKMRAMLNNELGRV